MSVVGYIKDFIVHTDKENVDLCGLFMNDHINKLSSGDEKFYFVYLDEIIFLSNTDNASFIDHIAMPGYPTDLYDNVNILPITRTGTTATHLKINYKGEPIFYINCPCSPGYSGSPVISYGSALAPINQLGGVLSVKLIGVFSHATITTDNAIVMTTGETLQYRPNLGLVIRICELEDIRRQHINKIS